MGPRSDPFDPQRTGRVILSPTYYLARALPCSEGARSKASCEQCRSCDLRESNQKGAHASTAPRSYPHHYRTLPPVCNVSHVYDRQSSGAARYAHGRTHSPSLLHRTYDTASQLLSVPTHELVSDMTHRPSQRLLRPGASFYHIRQYLQGS